jgi:hypothetical protein
MLNINSRINVSYPRFGKTDLKFYDEPIKSIILVKQSDEDNLRQNEGRFKYYELINKRLTSDPEIACFTTGLHKPNLRKGIEFNLRNKHHKDLNYRYLSALKRIDMPYEYYTMKSENAMVSETKDVTAPSNSTAPPPSES